jgi:hypothetical protein
MPERIDPLDLPPPRGGPCVCLRCNKIFKSPNPRKYRICKRCAVRNEALSWRCRLGSYRAASDVPGESGDD